MSGNETADKNSLLAYLSQAYLLPLMIREPSPPVQPFAPLWPYMEELSCSEQHSRALRKVTPIPLLALQNAVRTYFVGFEDRPKIEWEDKALSMPCPGILALTYPILSQLVVESERDFFKSLQLFMLGTAAEAIRTIDKRPFDEDELKFVRYRMEGVVTERKISTLYLFGEPVPPTGILRPGIVILSLPPWKFGAGDFQLFAARRSFVPGELDREGTHGPMWSNATKLWALLYDTCKVSGYRWFVVTTYNQWIFGTWSLDWTSVEMTPPLPFDKTQGMTLIEILIFWTQSARNKVRYWHLAPDAS